MPISTPATFATFVRPFITAALVLLALPSHAQWTLDSAASELRFVTIKNTNVAEVQQFKKLSGELAPSGAVKLVIELGSVETQIPLRNERLQTLLFDVAQFPVAQFEGRVDMAQIAAMKPGASLDLDLDGQLSLHGKAQDTKALLRVVRLAGERLQVSTRAPILVSAAPFDLARGIEKLRELMGLPNIIGTVPVSFALTFQK
jgi:polyisoprenoid-binding protein YceI